MLASLGTYLGGTTEEGQLAFKGRVMCMSAARAHVGVGDDLQDVRGTQLGHSAPVVEWEMVGFESFGGTEGEKAARWLRRGVGSGKRELMGFLPGGPYQTGLAGSFPWNSMY